MTSFKFALISPDQKYYTGKTGDTWVSSNIKDAFLYTLEEAHNKQASNIAFRCFVVRKILD